MGRAGATALFQSEPVAATVLVRPLGAGATFDVALVRHDLPGAAPFVLKRPIPRLRDRPEGALALEREWDILRAFPQSSLPDPLFLGRDDEGPCLGESFADGVPLRALLADARGGVDGERFRLIARDASRALADLHEHDDDRGPLGFVHGDISPDNLLFDGERVRFVDFATSLHRDGASPVFPAARGTLPYAPPEIAREEAPPSAAADTYALAAILARLLVPELTDARGGAALLAEVGERGLRLDRLAAPTDLPARALTALRAALAFDPRDRLASSRELARELGCALA